MKHTRNTRIVLFAIVIALLTAIIFPAAAQDETAPKLGYFLAPDADGTQQVFQLILDGESEPRQITFANADVKTFGVAYDGLGIAYISGGQLIITSIHSDLPEVLAEITTEYYGAPVFSQDGNTLAYSDNGVWLIDLSTREGYQVIANIPFPPDPFAPDAGNVDEAALYYPREFVPGTTKLLVDVGVWEWYTVGVLDYETGEITVLDGHIHTDLIPRDQNTVVLFGNTGWDGDFAPSVASMDDLNTSERAPQFDEVKDLVLYSDQGVRIAPDILRVIGTMPTSDVHLLDLFSYEFNMQTLESSNYNLISIAGVEGQHSLILGAVSPDGQLVAIYFDTETHDHHDIVIYNLITGEAKDYGIPSDVKHFRWQPVPAQAE